MHSMKKKKATGKTDRKLRSRPRDKKDNELGETSQEETEAEELDEDAEFEDRSQESDDEEIEDPEPEEFAIDESQMDAGQLQLMKYLKVIDGKVEGLKKSVPKIQKLERTIIRLENQVKRSDNEIAELKTRVDEAELKYQALYEKHLSLDTYMRKENLLFHGVQHTQNEKCQDVIKQFLKNEMKIPSAENMKFQNCHRLSGRNNNSPIICRFMDLSDRELVWNKRFTLQGSQVFISENFPPEIEERRRILYPIRKAAKSHKHKATIKKDKIVIDGNTYTIESLDKLPPHLNPATLATVTKNDITCFFGGASPLSNFHIVKEGIFIDHSSYDCVERYFQMSRAVFAQKPDIAQKIRSARGPLQCKILGDSITLDEDAWLPEAKEAMYKACRCKFEQHTPSRDFLLATKNTELVEAGPNKVWGIGIKKENSDAFDKSKWGQAQNLLGVILSRVREELNAHNSQSKSFGDF